MQGNLEWLQRQHLWLSVWDKSLSGAEVLLGQGELPILEACRASKVKFVQIVSCDVQLLNVSKFDAADFAGGAIWRRAFASRCPKD